MTAATTFLTIKALGTFTGAATATVVVGNTARFLAQKDLIRIPFVIALVFAYVQAEVVGDPRDVGAALLIVLNGCLLFSTALGAEQVLVAVRRPEETSRLKAQAGPRLRWLEPWIRAD